MFTAGRASTVGADEEQVTTDAEFRRTCCTERLLRVGRVVVRIRTFTDPGAQNPSAVARAVVRSLRAERP